MHSSHIAKASRGELCREKKKRKENKPVCKLQITDYSMNHDRNKLKIKSAFCFRLRRFDFH